MTTKLREAALAARKLISGELDELLECYLVFETGEERTLEVVEQALLKDDAEVIPTVRAMFETLALLDEALR